MMNLLIVSQLTKSATAFAMVLGTSTTFVTLSVEPVFAEGSGSSGRGRTRVLTSSAEVASNPGGGATSRRDAKASHSTAVAAAAAPSGELNSYREGYIALQSATSARNAALAEYMRLTDMAENAVASEFPNGGYDAALAQATTTFADKRDEISNAQAVLDQSLIQLTGGEVLSDEALQDLHGILGL